ncbi:MAG: phosphotransferase [Chloroflexi bacterium]|nr:phosphotransferase [Chloroflexota bacterium]MBP8058086.1 phosphotransferase [Chloroflexota bacterium]
MQEQPIQLPWEQPGWLEEATAWMQAQLGAQGWQVVTPVELLHQRPWSTFARVGTDKGLVYFKAPAPPFFEAPLTQFLAQKRPDCTVSVLAIERDRGWILSPDAGMTVRSASPTVEQVDDWLKLLPAYAEFQMQMAEYVPDVLAMGMPDRRLAELPGLYDELMGAHENLRVGLEPGLTAEEYERLLALRPRLTLWCEQLASYGLPETLTHEELHDANVLVNEGRYIYTDWSDSCVGHPFFTMLVTIRAAAHRLKLEESGPEMERLRDAYLEPWTIFAPQEQLAEAFRLAYKLGMLNRALSWHHGTGSLAMKHKEAYADYVPGWLQDFLQ